MSDLGSELKENAVIELQAPVEVPESDGWGDGMTADTNPDTNEADIVGSGSDTDGVRGETADDGWGREVASESTDTTPEANEPRSEMAADGWQEAPEIEAATPDEDVGSDTSDDLSADAQGREVDVEAARAEVADAYEGQPKPMDFADVSYQIADGGEGVGFEPDHANRVIEVQMPDGEPGFLKPATGEDVGAAGRGDCIPDGTAWRREVAAFEVDSMLGLGVVPETVAVQDPAFGEASLQDYAPYGQLEVRDDYEPDDIDRMAILDYVAGNTDRHANNYLTQIDGRPAAIDNGYSFPIGNDVPLKSDFIVDRLGRPLSEEVLSGVRSVDLAEFRDNLDQCGIEAKAIEGAVARLEEVQRDGKITGASWNGQVRDGFGRLVRS